MTRLCLNARAMFVLAAAAAICSACSGPTDQKRPAPAAVQASPAPVAQPVAPATPPAAVEPATVARGPEPIVVPPEALYVCVTESGGRRSQQTIEFTPEVAKLCRNHPEMGPCQYERAACRRSGGRVFAAGAIEITAKTEAEYDKHVMRVPLRSN